MTNNTQEETTMATAIHPVAPHGLWKRLAFNAWAGAAVGMTSTLAAPRQIRFVLSLGGHPSVRDYHHRVWTYVTGVIMPFAISSFLVPVCAVKDDRKRRRLVWKALRWAATGSGLLLGLGLAAWISTKVLHNRSLYGDGCIQYNFVMSAYLALLVVTYLSLEE